MRVVVDSSIGADLRISVLGPIAVQSGGASLDLGGPKQRAVLAVLVANVGTEVSAGEILAAVWGPDAPESHRRSLQTYVSNLRAILDLDIVRIGDSYRLDLSDSRVDAAVFEGMAQTAAELITTDPDRAGDQLRQALSLWQGRPYSDLSYVEGLQGEIRRLEDLRLSAVEARLEADLVAGRHQQIITEVAALAEEYPLRERFRVQHMLALYRSGRQAEALRAYQKTSDYLAEEMGLEPSQELQDLELAILQQDDTVLRGPMRATTQRLSFLVTDLEDSTGAWDRDPQAMAEALAIHDRILTETVQTAGGRVFKHTGDGVIAAFPDVSKAAQAAETAQRGLASVDWGDAIELRVRMGIDFGEAESRSGDFFGPPLNRAARLTAAAHGGQVLVSAAVQADLTATSPAGLQIRQLGQHHLRGFAAPESIGQLVFVGLPADFPDLQLDTEVDLGVPIDAYSVPGYELREQIGEGAFGVVYRAYQPSVGREVAIKVIRPRLAAHPHFIQRFEAEARTIARLAHPRIVPLVDFWRDPNGAYLVLQLQAGGSLTEGMSTGSIDLRLAMRVLHHIGEALDHAHSQGIAHGDLKPTNVLLDGSENAYLTDFGITARLLEPDLVTSISGSPEFRAPEEKNTGPTPAADLYAFGVIARHLVGYPEADAVLARANATKPEDRYPSAAAFLADLDDVLEVSPNAIDRPAVSRNPYKGLRAFEEGDASDFFGRAELAATLVIAVDRHRFVTVAGSSGSGKSSVVQAGLLPRLAAGAIAGSAGWIRVVFTPGSDPVESLAEALAAVAPKPMNMVDQLETHGIGAVVAQVLEDPESELLLVVDQFEELYTLVDIPERRDLFTTKLIEAVTQDESRVRVVVTLRADYYDRPLDNTDLGRFVRDGLVTVLRPINDELIEMITAPAQAVGLHWEPGLPQRIAQDVSDQPGGLPLLQYTLTEMVERRRGDLLTSDYYEQVGGVAGALAGRAETVFQEFDRHQRDAIREIFLRLVSVDEETDDTRRRVRRTELESLGINRSDVQTVLDSFIRERLLLADRDPVTRGPTIEVAHEALLRNWPRLRSWIEDERDSLTLSRRFRAARDEWVNAGEDDGYLLTGPRLAPFTVWAEHTSLSADEREFLERSRERDAQLRGARRRRRRTLIGILTGAALVAVVLAGWAFVERGRATDEADRAERNASLARSRELAAFAINALDDDPTLSKLLAVAAADIADPPLESISALHRASAADKTVARYSWPEGTPVAWQLWTHMHPQGNRLVAAGADGLPLSPFKAHLEVVDIASGSVLWEWNLDHAEAVIERPRFTDDGELVVAGAIWETSTRAGPPPRPEELGIFIWDADTGDLVDRLDLGTCGGQVQALSSTRALVMTIPEEWTTCWFERANEWTLELIDLETGDSQTLTTMATQGVGNVDGGAAFSGDGRYVAFNEYPLGRVVILDAQTGERTIEFEIHDPDAPGFHVRRMNEDGSLLVLGQNPIQVINTSTGDIVTEIDLRDSWVELHDHTLYATTQGGDMHAFDLEAGNELFTIPSVGPGNISIVDDARILVSDSDSGATLIDTRPSGGSGAVETCRGLTWASLTAGGGMASFSRACDADQLQPGLGGTTGAVLTTYVVDAERGELGYRLPDGKGRHLPISPDGKRFVRQQGEGAELAGPLQVRDLQTGEVMVELEGTCWYDTFEFFQGRSECVVAEGPPFVLWAQRVHWSPDGNMVGAVNGYLRGTGAYLAVWDAHTGELLFTELGNTDLGHHVDFAFTPDSSSLVASYHGQALREFSTETWDLEREVPIGVELSRSGFGSEGFNFIGHVDDGQTLLAMVGLNESVSFSGSGSILYWLDASTLEVRSARENLHDDGDVRAAALNDDHTLLATASSDGVVRVWNAVSGALVHEAALEEDVLAGVAFVDDSHLAVTPRSGGLLIITIDPDELLDLAADSLTRGFTDVECEKFNFGDECPTLSELSRGSATSSR